MSNQTHSAEINSSYGQEIEAFDKLPPRLRNAVANSPFTISSKMILNLYQVMKNEDMCLKAIEQIEDQFRNGVL